MNITTETIRNLRAYAPEFATLDEASIKAHLETHKYLVNETIPFEISEEDTLFSWYENVYQPVNNAINSWNLASAFPDLDRAELFNRVCTHWHFLKENTKTDLDAEDAVRSYGTRYASSLLSRLMYRIA